MADKLTFSSMSWDVLQRTHGLQVTDREALFGACAPVEPSLALLEILKRGRRSRLVNERVRATRLVDPVLAEVEMLRAGKIATLLEVPLEAKGMEGLCGNPDFLITAGSSIQITPIIAIVEAKREDIEAGLPQCAAELYCAHLMNQGRPDEIFGGVTTGTEWKFLCFQGAQKEVLLDSELYFITEPAKLLGVLCHMVDVALRALGEAADPTSRR